MTLPTIQSETMASLPGLIDRAVQVLSGARNAAEVLEARDLASLAYDAAKRAARIGKAKSAHDSLIAAAHRAQADAHEIQALASRRLADEYDAAQERGEVATRADGPAVRDLVPGENKIATAADLGLSRKDIHEARLIRDAEKAEPGIVRRALDEALASGEEPTRAHVRRAVLKAVKPEQQPKRGKEAIVQRVRDAIVALSGLPDAEEVAGYFDGTDAAIIVSEKLPVVREWVENFSGAWEE